MLHADKIRSLASRFFGDVVAYRHALHVQPELAFQENNTARFIASRLKEFNIPFKSGVAKTGIVALLQGKNPKKKIIALRADMDALPIEEANKVSYRSRNPGVMHACGHDVHMASLLGTARILAHLRDEWEGTVKFIFQPSEEKAPGGASVMIKEGVLKNPKPACILGQHVTPELEVGKIGIRKGVFMASSDELYITIKGKGGHAAQPHKLIDPVLIASHVIVGLQQVVSRQASPLIPSVLSFGKVIANGATNIIPDEVKIEGTFRTFDEQWRKEAKVRMKQLAEQLAASMGGRCVFNIVESYPVLINDSQLTETIALRAADYVGASNVVEMDMRMGSEDFAFYSHHIPACFYRLGTGNAQRGICSPVHTPTFDIDERALEIGMGFMAYAVAAM
ncbi:MAG: N-acyl-L-amino acid amidohydrolase [Chitinophagales bacterium]|nr:MAG: N-acyl-L-amino acid amidohydrolase [Chitinophagales bacterium]